MSQSEATTKYQQALKAGKRTYKNCLMSGRYPYLQILDEILSDDMIAGRVDLGVIDVPAGQIVGAKSIGRRTAFAADFMPLLSPDSEFAAKWIALCAAHLSDEGIRDPVRCYEYMGRFYVLEGNKRVSVLKSFGAASVPGYVTRIIPRWSEDEAVAVYYEFMDFYRLSGQYEVYFSHRGGFSKLQAALGYDPEHVWTDDERRRFQASWHYFKEAFDKLGGGNIGVTTADALLVWLEFYPLGTLKELSRQEIERSLASIMDDVKARAQAEPIEVSVDDSASAAHKSLLGRIFAAYPQSDHLNVAFVNRPDPEHSLWIASHELGRRTMERALTGQVSVKAYDLVPEEDVDAAMDRAVSDGAEVVFTTTPPLITACRRLAARRPDVKVLNCSVCMPYTGVRTYYSRVYEGKFITGAIAGAVAKNDRIGYVASSPIYGVPASINAFALGAQLTNPDARIQLVWSAVSEDPIGELRGMGVDVISNRDVPMPNMPQGDWGLSRVMPDGSLKALASPYWDWGNFYIRLISSILHGGWDAMDYRGSGKAVNYWWGMASGAVGLMLAEDLPDGVRSLANVLTRGIIDGIFTVFHRRYRSQDGSVVSDGNRWLSPEETLHMDYLLDNVDGSIPGYDELLPMARPIIRLQGLYRDQLAPEKGVNGA
ncbi:MAG TPA: BMP family ABC transporter substrate-binding protein [Candidatus Scatomorpha gallistercoris]|nr:BMP family ABC transporter substrate-binding protein [Candidatus Scatomorpha gallistercoris]